MVAVPVTAPARVADVGTRSGVAGQVAAPAGLGLAGRTSRSAKRTPPPGPAAVRSPVPDALRVHSLPADAGESRLDVLTTAIPAPTVSPSAPQAASIPPPVAPVDGSAGARIIAEAGRYLGVPYVYDGATPEGFDCSGYTMWVYAHAGVASLPHNSEAQRQMFRAIPAAEARPGDLVFYLAGGVSYHVAIYAGGNLQYAAPATGQVVKIETIWSTDIVFGTIWH
jgi:cell wall-associated NlpC family hydrolase